MTGLWARWRIWALRFRIERSPTSSAGTISLQLVLPAHGSVRIAAELWSSSKSSLLNRCFGDLWGGRASLTLHRNPSSSSRVLAPARQFEVCPESVVGQKTNQKSVWRPKQVPTIPVLPTSEARPQDHRRLQIRRTRGSPID